MTDPGMPTDQEIARAQALGRAAAREHMRLTDCPYSKEQGVLRARWALAYAGVQADEGEAPVAAAAGHDVTPGHDELHHWWVFGAGRERWHTWTELRDQLLEHMTPERAKLAASAWFLERFGYASGSDINRVKHGKPPRGNRVGPG